MLLPVCVKAVHLCIRILPAGSACVKYKLYGYEIDEIFVCGIGRKSLVCELQYVEPWQGRVDRRRLGCRSWCRYRCIDR